MNEVFESRSQALRVAASRTTVNGIYPEDAVREFFDRAGVVERVETPIKPSLDVQPLLVGSFAIRNDVLLTVEHFLGLLKGAIKLAAGIGSLSTLTGSAAVADALQGLYKLYGDIRAKGMVLSELDLATVSILRDLGGATAAEIASRMNIEVSADVVEGVLSVMRHGVGREQGFTSRDDEGVWTLIGL